MICPRGLIREGAVHASEDPLHPSCATTRVLAAPARWRRRAATEWGCATRRRSSGGRAAELVPSAGGQYADGRADSAARSGRCGDALNARRAHFMTSRGAASQRGIASLQKNAGIGSASCTEIATCSDALAEKRESSSHRAHRRMGDRRPAVLARADLRVMMAMHGRARSRGKASTTAGRARRQACGLAGVGEDPLAFARRSSPRAQRRRGGL